MTTGHRGAAELLAEESAKVTRNHVVRQRAISEQVTELMMKYTNQQLTSAQVIAELVAMAKEISTESQRGAHFTPPLDDDQFALYDAVAQHESAVTSRVRGCWRRSRGIWWPSCSGCPNRLDCQGGRPRQIEILDQALLVKHGYPPDK